MSTEARRAIEAILMVTDRPIEANLLAQVTELPVATVEELCDELAREYENDGRGFVLARVAGGYRYQSHPDVAAYVERFVLEGQSARLSAAALETLAIVAYKQPISRAQVASIRGVNVDGVMRTLQQRGYIDEIGRDPGPGNAVMFGTTSTFLERLGLDSLQQLPALGGFVPGADVVEQLERTLKAEPQSAPEPPDTSDTPDTSVPAHTPDTTGAGHTPDATVSAHTPDASARNGYDAFLPNGHNGHEAPVEPSDGQNDLE
jgi:segregation and condensation protein B